MVKRKESGGKDKRGFLDILLKDLTKFYREKQPKWKHITIHNMIDLTSGWETELYGFTLKYFEDNQSISKRLVARLYQGKFAAEKAKHEFDVIGKLCTTGYPVPQVYDIGINRKILGVPFITMDLIEGHAMIDDFLETRMMGIEPHLKMFTNLFADLHQIDPSLVFPEFSSFSDTLEYISLTLKRMRKSLKERGPLWLSPVLDWLEENKSEVSLGQLSILHRDFHPGNIIVKPDNSKVVIDWSASSFGDSREDLMWTFLLASAFWGRPFGDSILEGYQNAIGEEVKDTGFFEVRAIFRRIRDTSISFINGAEEASMRAGAVEQMKKEITHLYRVHEYLEKSTGIRLLEFDEILETVDGRTLLRG